MYPQKFVTKMSRPWGERIEGANECSVAVFMIIIKTTFLKETDP